jgi:hypothetical protein
MSDTTASESQSPGLFWTIFIGAIFLYAFCASGFFIYSAVVSDRGVITDSAYDDSLRYEEDVIQRLRASQELGWKLTVMEPRQAFQISLVGRDGEPLSDLHLKYKGYYLAGDTRDVDGVFLLSSDKEGAPIYSIDTPLPAPGMWLFEIEGTSSSGEVFFYREKLLIR